ncbi:MAG: insulinase family protein [Shewanella sp.]|nr:insulinase family protein [Shewanella sp.]
MKTSYSKRSVSKFIISTLAIFVSIACLTACQQRAIEFTPASPPSVPTFDDKGDFPDLNPDWSLIDLKNTKLATLEFGLKDGFKSNPTVHVSPQTNSHNWRIKLVGINRTEAIKNADVLVRAFSRHSKYLLNEFQSVCRESLSLSATYHSIGIEINCPELKQSDISLLSGFWNKQAIEHIDIDSVRRGLKLNDKLASVTGNNINSVFQKGLLSKHHPYLKVIGNKRSYDYLSKQQAIDLQQKTAEQLEWHLMIEAPKQLSSQEFLELSQVASSQLPQSKVKGESVTQEVKKLTQSKTIYLLDAPDSVDIRVRIGLNFNKEIVNAKKLTNSEVQLSDQKSRFACSTLSALLGRGSFGRLFYDLRSTRGLTYGAYAHCREQPLLRALVLYGSASIEHSGAFTEGMLAHFDLIKNTTAEKAEIDSLKLSLLGNTLIADEQQDNFNTQQLLEPNFEENKRQRMMWLKALSSEQVKKMANVYLQRSPVVVIRADADAVMQDLKDKLPEWNFVVIEDY